MKSQLWTIHQPDDALTVNVLDENGNTLARGISHFAATKIVTNRAAALAGAAWIFGNTYEGQKHPPLVDMQPVIEAALGPQGHKEKGKK